MTDEETRSTEATQAARLSREAPLPAAPEGTGKHWYVIHTYSGYENKVKANLEHRIESMRCSRLAFTLFSWPE